MTSVKNPLTLLVSLVCISSGVHCDVDGLCTSSIDGSSAASSLLQKRQVRPGGQSKSDAAEEPVIKWSPNLLKASQNFSRFVEAAEGVGLSVLLHEVSAEVLKSAGASELSFTQANLTQRAVCSQFAVVDELAKHARPMQNVAKLVNSYAQAFAQDSQDRWSDLKVAGDLYMGMVSGLGGPVGAVAGILWSLFSAIMDQGQPDPLKKLYKKIMEEMQRYVGQSLMQNSVQEFRAEFGGLVEELSWVPAMLCSASGVEPTEEAKKTQLVYNMMLQHDVAKFTSRIRNSHYLRRLDQDDGKQWAFSIMPVMLQLEMLQFSLLLQIATLVPAYRSHILDRLIELEDSNKELWNGGWVKAAQSGGTLQVQHALLWRPDKYEFVKAWETPNRGPNPITWSMGCKVRSASGSHNRCMYGSHNVCQDMSCVSHNRAWSGCQGVSNFSVGKCHALCDAPLCLPVQETKWIRREIFPMIQSLYQTHQQITIHQSRPACFHAPSIGFVETPFLDSVLKHTQKHLQKQFQKQLQKLPRKPCKGCFDERIGFVKAPCYQQLSGGCRHATIHLSGCLKQLTLEGAKARCEQTNGCGGFDFVSGCTFLKGRCDGSSGKGFGYQKVEPDLYAYKQIEHACGTKRHLSANLGKLSLNQCSVACDKMSSCAGFDSLPGRGCWLKGDCDGKIGGGSGYRKWYQRLAQACGSSMTLTGSEVNSVGQCAARCDSHADCQGFDSNGRECFLKSQCAGKSGSGTGYQKLKV